MAGIAKLLDEHRQALSAEFKSTISSLETKIDCLQTAVSDHSSKIASLEYNANVLDERMLALEMTYTALSDSNAKLLAKVTYLESCSHRNNVRIIGLPESIYILLRSFHSSYLTSLVRMFCLLHRRLTS